MSVEKYLPFLKKVLTQERLNHSLGVMQVMSELAEVYELDQEKAKTIGILHDAAKDLPKEKIDQLLIESCIETNHPAENDFNLYLHGPVGAYLVRKELGITDQLVLDAISTHCYFGFSPYFHHPLSWCLRFSDILEPTRNWSEEPMMQKADRRLRKLAYSGEMMEGAFFIVGALIVWQKSKGMPIHPNRYQIKSKLSTQLNLDDSFFELDDI